MSPTSDPLNQRQQNPQEPESLQPTTRRELVLSAVAGCVIAALLLSTLDSRGAIVPITPWSLATCFALLAGGAWWYARGLRKRLAEQPREVSSVEGVRALVAGKVLALSGAVLAGAHLVYALKYLSRWDVPSPRERVIHGVATLVAATLMAVAGRDLEHACISPTPPDDDEELDPGPAPSHH